MAKLPPRTRIHIEELTEAPEWMKEKVFLILNSFMQSVREALDEGLTLDENLTSKFVDIEYGAGSVLTFQSPLSSPIKAILIGQISGTGLSAGNTVVWQQIGQTIEITNITGLTAGESYKVRLLLL